MAYYFWPRPIYRNDDTLTVAKHSLWKVALRLRLVFHVDQEERFLTAKFGLHQDIVFVLLAEGDVGKDLFVHRDESSVPVEISADVREKEIDELAEEILSSSLKSRS